MYSRQSQTNESSLHYRFRGFTSAPNSPFLAVAQRVLHAQNASPTESAEEMEGRIGAMFPTAEQCEIKKLLKRYHYREAVVVSALQVQKHPVIMPGPGASIAPSPSLTQRQMGAWLQNTEPQDQSSGLYHPAGPHKNIITVPGSPFSRSASRAGSNVSNTVSPRPWIKMGSPIPSKPPSSPKIKLRYLKSVFPKAEETFLLDLLSNSDNNVQTATQKLLKLGHVKRDMPIPLTPKKWNSAKADANNLDTLTLASSVCQPTSPVPPRRPKTCQEKLEAKQALVKQFQDVVEQVIELALESSDYDQGKANQVLMNAQIEQGRAAKRCNDVIDVKKVTAMKYSPSGLLRGFTPCVEKKFLCEDSNRAKPKHPVFPLRPMALGANDNLLSKSYVNTQGGRIGYALPNNAKGPNTYLLSKRDSVKGPNGNLVKGPAHFAKGLIKSMRG